MSAHWSDRPEGGSRFALWLIRCIALHGGRAPARLLLYPITLYFYLRRRNERHASRAFLQRVHAGPVRPWHVLRHIHSFASTILDRVFLLSRGARGFDMHVEGLEQLDALLQQRHGVMLLGSHHGSFEVLRVLAERREDVPLRIVLDKRQSPALTRMLEALSPNMRRCIIDASQEPTSVVLALSEAVAGGQMVALLADRARAGERVRHAPFLGHPAPFPVGPFALAAALRVPVMLCFGLYHGGNRYSLIFEPFADRVVLPRARRAAALDGYIARYARRLEHHVRGAPYNWFNFYDFWHDPRPDDSGPGRTAVAGQRR